MFICHKKAIFATMNEIEKPFGHLQLLNTGYADHDADWNWRDVRSPFARIYYVTQGEAWVEMGGVRKHLTAGNLYIIPPFTTHTDICKGKFCHYYIHVYEDSTQGSVFEEMRFPFEITPDTGDLEMFRRLRKLNPLLALPESNPQSYDNYSTLFQNLSKNRLRSTWYSMETYGMLYVIVSRFLHYAEPKQIIRDERVKTAVDYIRQHINNRMEIRDLAAKAFLSVDHFIRIFRAETGETPISYIIRQKMERAEQLLVTTDMSVKEVASYLGYDETSYFIRLFRRKTSFTPVEYRKGRAQPYVVE